MAVLGRQPLGTLADLLAKALAGDGVFHQLHQRLCRAEGRLDAELLLRQHAHLVQLERRAQRGPQADRVHAFLVAQLVDVLQRLQVAHAVGGAQRPGGFVLQPAGGVVVARLVLHAEVVGVLLADAPAGDGAAEAGLVGHQLRLAVALARAAHGLGADGVGLLELHVAVVARGQRADFVDHVHQHLRAVRGQALAGHGVLGQDLLALHGLLHEGLGIAHVAHALGAAHGNGLQVLAAHHGAHARAASRAVQVVHHGGKQHAVLTRPADAGDAHLRVLQFLLDDGLGVPHALAPQLGGIAQFHLVVLDVEPHGLGRLALEDDHVPAGELQLGAPVAARVGAGDGPRERTLGDDGVAPAGRGHGARERAGGPDQLVLRRQRVDLGIDLRRVVLGAQPARADVGACPLHVQRFGLDGARRQVDAENLSSPGHDVCSFFYSSWRLAIKLPRAGCPACRPRRACGPGRSSWRR